MGAGIAEVFARNGFTVIGVEQNEHGLERGREHLEHSTGRAVSRGKMTEEEQAEVLDRISFSTDLKDLAHADLVVEAVVESLAAKTAIFRALDAIVAPDAILATNTSSLSVTEISTANARPGRVIGVHFFNPAPVQKFVEIVRTVVTEPRRARRRGGPRRPARQEPGHLRRQGRLHRQHAAVRLPQPRGRDVRGPVRLPRGHRRRDALRLRLPDGTAGAARPDRPRHGVRDPRHDVQAGPRPPARARAVPQADGDRRPARSEVRPRLLHLRRARQLPRSSPTSRPRPPTTGRSCATTSRPSASSAPARWRRGSSRSSPRPGTT